MFTPLIWAIQNNLFPFSGFIRVDLHISFSPKSPQCRTTFKTRKTKNTLKGQSHAILITRGGKQTEKSPLSSASPLLVSHTCVHVSRGSEECLAWLTIACWTSPWQANRMEYPFRATWQNLKKKNYLDRFFFFWAVRNRRFEKRN